jgi:hypothetical protein
MHLRQEGTPTPRRRPAPGDEHSRRFFPGGPFPSKPAETSKSIESASTRGSGLPYAPFATARPRVRQSLRQARHPSAQHSVSKDERRKRTSHCAGKKRKMTISRPLAETSLDSRPNSALEFRPHGASLCRRSDRSTAPSGMGHDTRPSRTPRAPSPLGSRKKMIYQRIAVSG